PHGRAVAETGWYYDSSTDEALTDLDLSEYSMLIWATGEESTDDESFSTAQQELLRDYVADGGTLWVSGAEILWDLDEKGSESDRAFAEEILGVTLDEDNANATVATGVGLLDGLEMDFGTNAPYPVEYPDTLASEHTVIAQYEGGATAGTLGNGVAMFGFPFDAIGDETAQANLAEALLPALVPDYVPPDPEDDVTADKESHRLPRLLLRDLKGCNTSPMPVEGCLIFSLLALVRRQRRIP
ncbi:MAG: hypothetical protein HN348_10590, partial [Proteobacteria bacterium]|nr:hypothetical protein [Pseudomonadota bacterium]